MIYVTCQSRFSFLNHLLDARYKACMVHNYYVMSLCYYTLYLLLFANKIYGYVTSLFIHYETDKLQAKCDYPKPVSNTEVSEHGNIPHFVQIKHDLSINKLPKTTEEKWDKNKLRTCRTPHCAKSYSHSLQSSPTNNSLTCTCRY